MRLPERPAKITDLDLMARLLAYAEGRESWLSDRTLGEHEKNACRQLHANLTSFVERCLHPLMDRVTAREMEAFTMHDHGHGLKVAHIMWHIIDPIRRNSLTPGEIALLVISAHLHDLGMGLSKEEREARLRPESDLWDRLDGDGAYAAALARLANIATQTTAGNSRAAEAAYQVQQAQEALLCIDCRERHATRERYEEILQSLQEMHRLGPATIPDPKAALSFDGDSYQEKLIEICVSHNEDVQTLLERDPRNIDQWRFPTDYPIGCCNADTRFVATTLRLADILDFDRERTPPVLFYYILPKSGDPSGNTSIREWSKHLAISNWEIENSKLVFRGRSPTALIHHTIVEFCKTIENEILNSRSVFNDQYWPYTIMPNVECLIEATGYRYVPYRFTLDEERIYELLMGKGIYNHPLAALRELIQNSVDACLFRDALTKIYDDSITLSNNDRIIIEYRDNSANDLPNILSVIDSGIGMDRIVIENYFLKVGRSYYNPAISLPYDRDSVLRISIFGRSPSLA